MMSRFTRRLEIASRLQIASRFQIAGALALLVVASLAAGTLHAADEAPGANAGTQVKSATSGAGQDRSSRSPPEALFVEKCAMCHRQMGMGTVILARRMDPAVSMLEARRDMPAEFIIQAARAGVGNMPRISRGEVSDAQLQVIARYLARPDK
jgi:mono/diheme cytochrome c family protein